MRGWMAAGALVGLMLVGGCRGEDRSEDGLSARERSDLDNAAMMLEGNQVIDTSADSLVLDENAAAADQAEVSNGAAPANQAMPR